MRYADVVIIMLVLFIIYYILMIASDLYRAKLATLQDKETTKETEIDISDEVENFNTIHISREYPAGRPITNVEPSISEETADKPQEIPESQRKAINAAKREAQERIKHYKAKKENRSEDADPSSRQPDMVQLVVRNAPSTRPDYRMPLMMGGMTVEEIVDSAKRRAQGDNNDLSGIIHRCEAA